MFVVESGECGHERSRLLFTRRAEGGHIRMTGGVASDDLLCIRPEGGRVPCPQAINMRGRKNEQAPEILAQPWVRRLH
jgi:hypothetical protein